MKTYSSSFKNCCSALTDVPRYLLTPDSWQQPIRHETEILVVGGGAAGLMAALQAADHAAVTLLSRDPILESNSAQAQGGIAAALAVTDSPAFHIEDTLIAGAGLSDKEAVKTLTLDAPMLMRKMTDFGVPFERKDDQLVFGLEGGHSQRRILHVGDSTGLALTSTLAKCARRCPGIQILEGFQVIDLLGEEGQCKGILALDTAGRLHFFVAQATILTMGGAGALYGLTSNQASALGEGIAIAYRAGAEICDMEFVQFHPTVFRTHDGQGFLISEATRGEGGKLLTPSGQRFMPAYDLRAELAPRDIVTRGIFAAMQCENSDYVLLDLTHLSAAYLERRFPTITKRCREEGIDPATTPIPIAPAAHYLMGGIRTDLNGATNIAGLYAAGECACTGVHGANRLASNSLLECLVFGRRAGLAAVKQQNSLLATQKQPKSSKMTSQANNTHWSTPKTTWRNDLAKIMVNAAGPLRSATKLTKALQSLAVFPSQLDEPDSDALTAANAALTARLIASSALAREESRGAHYRTDFPHSEAVWHVHLVLTRGQKPSKVDAVADLSSQFDNVNEEEWYALASAGY